MMYEELVIPTESKQIRMFIVLQCIMQYHGYIAIQYKKVASF